MADFVMAWLEVNIAALIVLAVMSFVGSALALEGLGALDRWLDASLKPAASRPGLKALASETPEPAPP